MEVPTEINFPLQLVYGHVVYHSNRIPETPSALPSSSCQVLHGLSIRAPTEYGPPPLLLSVSLHRAVLHETQSFSTPSLTCLLL